MDHFLCPDFGLGSVRPVLMASCVCIFNEHGPATRPVIAGVSYLRSYKSSTKTNFDANQHKGQSAVLIMSQISPSMAERKNDDVPNDAPAGHAAPDHSSSLESPLESPAEKPADEGPELTLLTALQVLGGFMCLFNSYFQKR
jgi:hypothetical protein